MRAHIQPPSKIGVTGVTRVTPLAKRLNSLALPPVTHICDFRNTACNADGMCNRRQTIVALLASTSRAHYAGGTLRIPGAGEPHG